MRFRHTILPSRVCPNSLNKGVDASKANTPTKQNKFVNLGRMDAFAKSAIWEIDLLPLLYSDTGSETFCYDNTIVSLTDDALETVLWFSSGLTADGFQRFRTVRIAV